MPLVKIETRKSWKLSIYLCEKRSKCRAWIENRFWVRVYYAMVKIGRGEQFEDLDFISSLRTNVLGPPVLEQAEVRHSGIFKLTYRIK